MPKLNRAISIQILGPEKFLEIADFYRWQQLTIFRKIPREGAAEANQSCDNILYLSLTLLVTAAHFCVNRINANR